MKKSLIIAFLLVMFAGVMYAQEKEKYVYCEIVGTSKLMSTKVTIEVDYGQASSYFKKNKRLRDENGQPIVFNSMVDAMNMMGDDGWEFTQAYAVTMGQQNVYHWLLKKDISALTEEEKADVFSNYRTTK